MGTYTIQVGTYTTQVGTYTTGGHIHYRWTYTLQVGICTTQVGTYTTQVGTFTTGGHMHYTGGHIHYTGEHMHNLDEHIHYTGEHNHNLNEQVNSSRCTTVYVWVVYMYFDALISSWPWQTVPVKLPLMIYVYHNLIVVGVWMTNGSHLSDNSPIITDQHRTKGMHFNI